MRIATTVGLLGTCGLIGCFNTLQQGTGVESPETGCVGNCHHGSVAGSGATRGGSSSGSAASTTGGGSSSAASSSASAGGSSSSGSVQSSGGSSSGGSSGGADAGIDCPQLYVASTLTDVAGETPIAGATVSAVGLDGVTLPGAQAKSQADGFIALCVPPNVEFSLTVTATGYPETILEDVILITSETLSFGGHGMSLLSDNDLGAFSALVPVNQAMGTLLVSVNSATGDKSDPCYDSSGWQISITVPDGGAVPHQQVYIDNTFLPNPTLTSTESQGDAFFYDIDTSVTDRVAIVAINTNADAGVCPNINAQIGLQGTALVEPQAITVAPIVNP
jgi:hypothetical protein